MPQGKILIVCGATASGKTALSIELAKKLNTEIISADSMSIYRHLNIGTAKPSEKERQGIKHHMIDIIEPEDSFSVSDYENLAMPVLQSLMKADKIPIVCGGTGFYIDSLIYNRSLGKASADISVREKYENFLKENGAEKLHELLYQKDRASAEKLHKNDTRRVIRALEIVETTGIKKSEQNDSPSPRFDYTAVCIEHPREYLYSKINERVDDMLKNGLVDEVKALIDRGLTPANQCMQGIGYKECYLYLKNEINHSTTSDIIKKNSRNYAKRQITYFKKVKDLVYLGGSNIDNLADEVINLL